MKVSYQVAPKVTVEAEGESVKQVFERVSQLAAVFAEDVCGCCGSDRIVPRVRNAKGFSFYSLDCLKCRAELSLGQAKEGEGLFINRRTDDGQPKGKNGWEKYQGGQQGQAAPPVGRQNRSYQPDEALPY